MKQLECLIATCAQLPDLDPDDRILAQALIDRGVRVAPAVWNDPAVDWGGADMCVVRSTWDYHKNIADFDRWIVAAAAQTHLINPATVLRWNSHKFYLRELEKHGVAVVPTAWLDRGASVELNTLFEQTGWADAVIKPAHGASADGVLRVGRHHGGRALGQTYLQRLLEEQDVLFQPYLSTIAEQHERALVFIGGEFSHAVTKMPFMHANSDLALRSGHPPGTSGEVPVQATLEEVAIAARALEVVPSGYVYARVDLVRNAGAICVLEVELIEPTLYLYARPAASESLADAILAHYLEAEPSR